jgi:lysophospholipase L1-like esterase
MSTANRLLAFLFLAFASTSAIAATATFPGALVIGGSTGNPTPITGDPWTQELTGQAFVFEGNSITANPNGAGQTSYAGIIGSGTYPGATFFNGHGSCYVDAVGGAVIGSGTTPAANGPQTLTASWSGTTSTIILSGSATQTPGYMSVTGSNIVFPTSGTITSGTILTLSQPTSGGSGGIVTVRLGGNNIMDRMGEAYPHRPAANGGDGGPRAFLFLADGGGANCLTVGESGTNIINDILAVTATAESMGFIPVISPTLPTGYRGGGPTWWSPTQEGQRQIVNSYIRRHEVPGAMVVDMTLALSGESIVSASGTNWALFDPNGIHPIGYANAMLANYLNSEMLDMGQGYAATPEVVDAPKTFTNGVSIFSGTAGNITISNTNGYYFFVAQPSLVLGSTSHFVFGLNYTDGQTRALDLGFGYNSASGGGNITTLGQINNPCLYLGGQGQMAVGEAATAAAFNTEDTALIAKSYNADLAGHFTNTNSSAQSVALFDQPNATKTYGLSVGINTSLNNAMGMAFNQIGGNGSAANYWFLTPASNGAPVLTVDMRGDLLTSGTLSGSALSGSSGPISLTSVMTGGTNASYIDPVAAIPVIPASASGTGSGLIVRWTSHRPGSIAPVGIYQDALSATAATIAGQQVKGLRDDLATSSLILSNSYTTTCTLQYVNGEPVVRLAGNTNDAFQIGLSGTFSLNNADIWLRYRIRTSAGGGALIDGETAGNWVGSAGSNGFYLDTAQVGANPSNIQNIDRAAPAIMVTLHLMARSGACQIFANGGEVSGTNTGFPQGGITYLLIGGKYFPAPTTVVETPGGASSPLSTLDISAFYVGENLTATQIATIDASLTLNLSVSKSPYVHTGDSITNGGNSIGINSPDDMPDQFQLLEGSSAQSINDGHFGWGVCLSASGTLGSILPQTASELQYSGTDILEIGTNDLIDLLEAGDSVVTSCTTTEIALSAYIAALHPYCGKLILCTVLPRYGSNAAFTSGSFEAARQSFNSWIKTSSTNDGICDIGNDPQIGWSGSASGITNPATQTTYYNTDNTHLNVAGMKIFAQDEWLTANGGGKVNIVGGSTTTVSNPVATTASWVAVNAIATSGSSGMVWGYPTSTGTISFFSANTSGTIPAIYHLTTP